MNDTINTKYSSLCHNSQSGATPSLATHYWGTLTFTSTQRKLRHWLKCIPFLFTSAGADRVLRRDSSWGSYVTRNRKGARVSADTFLADSVQVWGSWNLRQPVHPTLLAAPPIRPLAASRSPGCLMVGLGGTVITGIYHAGQNCRARLGTAYTDHSSRRQADSVWGTKAGGVWDPAGEMGRQFGFSLFV